MKSRRHKKRGKEKNISEESVAYVLIASHQYAGAVLYKRSKARGIKRGERAGRLATATAAVSSLILASSSFEACSGPTGRVLLPGFEGCRDQVLFLSSPPVRGILVRLMGHLQPGGEACTGYHDARRVQVNPHESESD